MTIAPEDYFQRITAGATFHRALAVFTKRYDVFLILSAIVYTPFAAAMISIMSVAGSSMQILVDAMGGSGQYDDATTQEEVITKLLTTSVSFTTQFFLESVAFVLFSIAGRAAMSYAVGLIYANRDPHWFECFKKGFTKWCDLFCANVTVALCLGLGHAILAILSKYLGVIGFLLLLVWVVFIVFVTVSLIILAPVVMMENLGPLDGIQRTLSLSWDNRCYIFCTVFCFGLMFQLGLLVLAAILNIIGGSIFTVWGAFLMTLPVLLYLPLVIILETVVYLNIRVQREGLNHDVLVGDLDGATATAVAVDGKKTGQFAPAMYMPLTKTETA